MTRQKIVIAILLIVIFSPLALRYAKGKPGSQVPDLAALSDDDLKTLTIRLERSQCYGSCPAYALAIHGDGRVEYVGKQNVKVKESRTGRLDPAAVKELTSKFAEAKFLSLSEDDYSESKCKCRRCTDMASAVVEISVGSVSHRVNHYYGCACPPKALFDLESAIDKAVNAEQWTGDTSKQGPFGTTCFG
jgi:hypothetical protein